MSIDRKNVELFIALIVRTQDPAEVERGFAVFMCRCLEAARQWMPEFAGAYLDSASAFWLDGVADVQVLRTGRESCWEYLTAKGSGVDVRDKEDAAIRALICVLRSGYEVEDSVESFLWFADMFDRLGGACAGSFNQYLAQALAQAR